MTRSTDDWLRDEWMRLQRSRQRRARAILLLLAVLIACFVTVGVAAGPPSGYVRAEGIVEGVRSDVTTNSESGRRTRWWTKDIRVVDADGRHWTFSERDVQEYELGQRIEVLYDPTDPAGTLVPEYHVFNLGVIIAASLVAAFDLVAFATVAGLSIFRGLRSSKGE